MPSDRGGSDERLRSGGPGDGGRPGVTHGAWQVRLNDALRGLADPVEIQAVAVRLLGERLGVSRAHYGLVSADGFVQVERDFARGVSPLLGRFRMADYGAAPLALLRAGRTLVMDDLSRSELLTAEARAAYASLEVGAMVAVPLVKAGRLVGVLSVHQTVARSWLPDEVALLEETAERTWDAVECARAMHELQRAHADLRGAHEELERRVAERTAELARANALLQAEVHERARAERSRTALQRQLATLQEDERRRIARDLHDQTGQLLASLSLAVQAVAGADALPPPTAGRLAEVQRLADELGRQVHELAVRLRPTALDDLGLPAALRALVNGWSSRTGVPVDLQTVGLEPGRLPAEVETALYRIVQEALTNVAKHAAARQVSVIVHRHDGSVTAVIEDDGRGFDPACIGRDRLGLRGMRERVTLLGGQLDIDSAPGEGATLITRLSTRPTTLHPPPGAGTEDEP